jgi:signal transduction histidine kinase
LRPDVELATYRIVQEALNNALKHSGASTIRLGVAVRPGCLEIRVSDDGRGFDVEAVTTGQGLMGLAEYAALIRGRVEIRSRADIGTTIEVEVPI